MINIYELILNSLYSANNIKLEREKINFLKSLQPYVTSLRSSFKNKQINVDYRDRNVQAAYLIAYYPSYIEMTYEVLNRHGKDVLCSQNNILNVCLFGAGAAPEAVAIINFINENALEIEELNIYAYDIFASTWNFSINLVKNFIIPHLWQSKNFNINIFDLDLCEPDSLKNINQQIKSSNLFIFQNCLNELNKQDIAIANINYLVENIPRASRLIIADLVYNSVTNIKLHIEKKLEELSYNLDFRSNIKEEIRLQIPLPNAIRQHLLISVNGLIPRTKVRFDFISAYYPLLEVKELVPDRISLEALQAYIKDLEAKQTNFQKEKEDLEILVNQMQQQILSLQNQVETQLNLQALAENVQKPNASDNDAVLAQFDQSLIAVDSSLRDLVRQTRDNIVAQTRLAQQKQEKKLWMAIAVSSALGLLSIVLAIIVILGR
jgi:hypothetical protein